MVRGAQPAGTLNPEPVPGPCAPAPFLAVEHREGWVVVDLPEEVDLVNAGEIEKALLGLVATGHCRIVLDATRLDFIDSTGLSGLVRVLSAAQNQQGTVRLAHASPWTVRVMRVAGLHRVIRVYPSVEEALAD